jgi:hypothetical protein
MGILTSKLFGKWAGVASASAGLAVAVLTVVNPAILAEPYAVLIMTALGIHAAASDGITPLSGSKK